MATPTMDSIKKKMQSMKLEKENAIDRADQNEQKVKDLQEKAKMVRIFGKSIFFFSFFNNSEFLF
jgi:hypothetical protein